MPWRVLRADSAYGITIAARYAMSDGQILGTTKRIMTGPASHDWGLPARDIDPSPADREDRSERPQRHGHAP